MNSQREIDTWTPPPAFSDNEMIVLGGAEGFVGSDPIKHITTVEKYNTDGKLIQTLHSMNTAR